MRPIVENRRDCCLTMAQDLSLPEDTRQAALKEHNWCQEDLEAAEKRRNELLAMAEAQLFAQQSI